jgi:hypothetical protein
MTGSGACPTTYTGEGTYPPMGEPTAAKGARCARQQGRAAGSAAMMCAPNTRTASRSSGTSATAALVAAAAGS